MVYIILAVVTVGSITLSDPAFQLKFAALHFAYWTLVLLDLAVTRLERRSLRLQTYEGSRLQAFANTARPDRWVQYLFPGILLISSMAPFLSGMSCETNQVWMRLL